MYASLVHDALYQLMRIEDEKKNMEMGSMSRKAFRKKADKLYRHLCKKNGMNWANCYIRYRAIRWFGESSTVARSLVNGGSAPANQ